MWTNWKRGGERSAGRFWFCRYSERFWTYLVGDLGAEQPAGAARADGPGVHVLRVGPDQVAERSFVGDLLVPLDGPDLVQSLDVRREPAVDAEDLFVYQLEAPEHAGLEPEPVEPEPELLNEDLPEQI